MDNAKSLAIVWGSACAAIAVIVCSIVGGIVYYNVSIHTKAMEEGYSEQSLSGVPGTHWVKDGVTIDGEPVDRR